MAEFLIEVDAHNGTSVVTLRYSMSGYRTGPGDTPANTVYDARIKDPGTFSRTLFGDGRTLGRGDTANGEVVLINPDGALDPLLTYGFDGRQLVIKRLANANAAFSTATVVFRGTVDRVEAADAEALLELRLRDRRVELEEPVQTNRYTGTTTSGGLSGNLVNGTPDMKDKPKPLCYGSCSNVTPACVNPFDLIYQVHDGAVTSIVVCDGQVPLNSTGDYATAALLQAAHIPPGKSGTCLALGLFRIGCATYYTLTADVVEGAGGQRNASAVTQRLLAKMGLTGAANIDSASFTALASAAPQEVGIYLVDDTHGADAIGRVLESVGGYITTMLTGPFQVGIAPVLGTPTWTADKNTIRTAQKVGFVANPDTEKGLPAWRVKLLYGRSWTVSGPDAVCPGASAARRGFAAVETRVVKDDDSSVLTKFPLAGELVIETLLVSAADAATEAARRGDLYCALRSVSEIALGAADADAALLGSTGTPTYDRFGWDAGKDFVVTGREERLGEESVTLTLWG